MRKKILLFISMFLLCSITANAAVVKIGETEYSKLSTAISKVNAGVKTTITFESDVQENVTIPNGKDIVFDLNNYTLSNNGDKTVITNNGALEIKNGTITSDAGSGMINNNSKGVLTITSGNLNATGSRQVVYNDGGTLYIMPGAHLESETDVRSTLHNKNNGTVNIIGGTIIANNSYAIYNEKGTLNIGTKNDIYDKTSPIIIGKTYGIAANNKYNLYDGIIKGGTYHAGKTSNTGNTPTVTDDVNETKLNEFEEDSEKLLGEEVIGGVTYKTFTYNLDSTNRIKILFDANGGTSTRDYKWTYIGNEIGVLPDASRVDHVFDGWFTSSTGGVKVTSSTRPTEATTYYAHWTYVDPNSIAYVEGVGTMSLKDAINHGGNIRLEKDVIITENLFMNKEATLDLNGHTISLGSNIIVIKEEVTIDDLSENKNGKITSTADFGIIVGLPDSDTNGKLIHKGGTIEGLGQYGAIKNYETLEIDGGVVLGTATGTGGYVVYNHNNMTMKSGTIHSTNGRAVQVYKNSTFTMDGGLLKTDAENDQTLNLYGDCSATINGGTIEGLAHNTAAVAMFGNTNLVVNGGLLKGSAMAVAGNGNETSGNANITINDGTLIATDGVGMYLPQRDSVTTINGGNISGPTGIEIRASKLIVNDGFITGTSDVYEISSNASGTTSKGAAIAVSQHTTKLPIEVIINGGNLKSALPLAEANPMNNPQEALDLISITITQGNFESTGNSSVDTQDDIQIMSFITGGTYTTDPSKYVKEGYIVVKEADNKYIVTKPEDKNNDSSSENNISISNNIVTNNVKEVIESITTEETQTINSNLNNPKTDDNIVLYTFLLSLSLTSLILYTVIKKNKIFG